MFGRGRPQRAEPTPGWGPPSPEKLWFFCFPTRESWNSCQEQAPFSFLSFEKHFKCFLTRSHCLLQTSSAMDRLFSFCPHKQTLHLYLWKKDGLFVLSVQYAVYKVRNQNVHVVQLHRDRVCLHVTYTYTFHLNQINWTLGFDALFFDNLKTTNSLFFPQRLPPSLPPFITAPLRAPCGDRLCC